MAVTYGIPYMGSKNAIADQIVAQLPPAEWFVDLFAGGCAMTHAAILSGKYKKFLINDINPLPTQYFIDCAKGKYRDFRIVDRDEFNLKKGIDPYVTFNWSFGNNMEHYLWGKNIEKLKQLACKMLLDDNFERRYDFYNAFMIEFRKVFDSFNKNPLLEYKLFLQQMLLGALKQSGLTQKEIDAHVGTKMSRHWFSAKHWHFPTEEAYDKLREKLALLPPYEELDTEMISMLRKKNAMTEIKKNNELLDIAFASKLDAIARFHRCKNLELISNIAQNSYRQTVDELVKRSCASYDNVAIPENSTVYCDIPYINTQEYVSTFDHDAFYNWCRNAPFPVYVSEYSMPDDFKSVWHTEKRVLFSAFNNSEKKEENVFIHEKWAALDSSALF